MTSHTVTVFTPDTCSVDVWTSVDQSVKVVVWLSMTVVVVVHGTSFVVLQNATSAPYHPLASIRLTS